jgi:DNA polymerase-1
MRLLALVAVVLWGWEVRALGQMPLDEVLAALKPVLEDDSILKIGQNMKYDAKILARHGITVAPFDDTMLMSYAMHAGLNGHGMDALSDQYLGHQPIPIKQLIGSGKSAVTFDRVGIDDAVKYAAEDADVTLRLWRVLKPRLAAEGRTTVYETLERPLIDVLARMEARGIAEFLILDSRFPRSLAFCYGKLRSNLAHLAREYGGEMAAHAILQEADCDLHNTTIDAIFEQGLHEYIAQFISRNTRLANQIQHDYRFRD